MKVCLIGDGLVSLTLANVLIKKDLFVDIYSVKKNNFNDQSRTLGISKSNIDFFNNEIMNIEKILWNIQKIKIFTGKNNKKELLKFDNKSNQIYSIIRNNQLQKMLLDRLKRSKFVKFKGNLNVKKNYSSVAYTTTILHEKIKNNIAYQNFTKNGPIAFLPVSDCETSIVYSLKSLDKKNNLELNSLVEKYNPIYSIKKINSWSSFRLRSSSLRNYYKGNILAFGDLLHKIHPLAGQGFNMSLRDIKLLSDLIDEKINLGLDLDESICHEFQKKSQSKNFIFLSGIDWVYELFNIESKINSNLLKKSINIIGSNKVVNGFLQKFADSGIRY